MDPRYCLLRGSSSNLVHLCGIMREFLRQTNPAEKWLAERFQTELRLVNGRLIVVRFDLPSSGQEGFRFNQEQVSTQFHDLIMYDRENMLGGDYAAICDSVAAYLNQQIDIVAQRALKHALLSLSVLDALDLNMPAQAGERLSNLGMELVEFPNSEKLWGPWLQIARIAVDAATPPKTGPIDWNQF